MFITSKKYEIIFDINGDKTVCPINDIMYKLNNTSEIVSFLNIDNYYVVNELIDNIKVNDIQLTRGNLFNTLDVLFDTNRK